MNKVLTKEKCNMSAMVEGSSVLEMNPTLSLEMKFLKHYRPEEQLVFSHSPCSQDIRSIMTCFTDISIFLSFLARYPSQLLLPLLLFIHWLLLICFFFFV
jgi:hypothetical protein